jgi:hypothetical protein
MRKLALVAAGLVALVATGLAAAWSSDNGKSATAVAAKFDATTVGSSQTRSCTTSDGKTITTTKATYTGNATGASDLSGPITLDTRSVINTTDGVGTVTGKLKISATAGDTTAHFSLIYDHGNVAGLAEGHAATPDTKLLGNLSAGFSTTGGFSGGKLGGGTNGGSAVELGPGRCEPTKSEQERNEATGNVTAVTSTSITVAGVTCSIPANLAAMLQNLNLKVGDRVEIHCSVSNGATTLVKVERKR